MSEFTQAWQNLVLFLQENGTDNPATKVANIKRALLNAMPPSYPEDSKIIWLTTNDESLGVQQFLTKFGFHLNRISMREPENPERMFFEIVPNWK